MTRHQPFDFDTRCTRAGQGRRDGDSLVTPIVQSTTFCREGLESQAEHKYSRESNPTVAVLERALGELENAPPAVCYTTGLAAEAGLFNTFLQAGDHVVCSRALYGGTTRLLQQVLPRFGVETDFIGTSDLAAVQAAIGENTRLVFIETPANPTLDLVDIEAVSAIAHRAGALVAVDNTFLTPILQQPLELGADFSVYSTTKFIEGHSVALGGSVVTRDEVYLEELRFTRKCLGGIQTPFNAWLTLQGLKTLSLRIRRQSETAASIAEWLEGRSETEVVHYPTARGHGREALARAQHLGHHGAVVSFELRGGAASAREVLRRVELCRLVEHVGSVETLLTHSASMTHGGVPKEQRESVGVSEGLLRLSVGLEDPAAILGDLEQAIAGAVGAAESSEEAERCHATT